MNLRWEMNRVVEKMVCLTVQLKSQFGESDKLEGDIKKNLAGLGYDC